MKIRAYFVNVLLLAVTLLLLLAGAEILFRGLEKLKGGSFVQNPELAWSDRPNFYYKPDASNSFHDFRYPREKPEKTYRIATIGDSFSFTPYMQFDDVYPKRLSRMLNLHNPKERETTVQVLNYGQWGASTVSEIPYVERAIKAGADLIILQITLNDPQTLSFHKMMKSSKHKYTFGELDLSSGFGKVLLYWRSLGFVLSRLNAMRTQRNYVEYHKALFEDAKTWEPFRDAIRAMKHLSGEAGVPFVAVLFPFFSDPFDDTYPYLRIHEKLSKFLGVEGIKVLDLRSAYTGIPHRRLQVIPGKDPHPNEIAHRIASEHIYAWLEREKLIPSDLFISDKYRRRVNIKQDRIEKF